MLLLFYVIFKKFKNSPNFENSAPEKKNHKQSNFLNLPPQNFNSEGEIQSAGLYSQGSPKSRNKIHNLEVKIK